MDSEEKIEQLFYKSQSSIITNSSSVSKNTSTHQLALLSMNVAATTTLLNPHIVDETSKGIRRHSALSSAEWESSRKAQQQHPRQQQRHLSLQNTPQQMITLQTVDNKLQHTVCPSMDRRPSSNAPPRRVVTIQTPPSQDQPTPSRNRRKSSATSISSIKGQVHLQICHDPKANILYVTVIKAKLSKGLTFNEDGTDHVPVDPYIVCTLFPERVLENQRRTRHVPMCSEPEFQQTMVYPNITWRDLRGKMLEVCAWNNNPVGEDELFGKVVLSLSGEPFANKNCSSFPLFLHSNCFHLPSCSVCVYIQCAR